MFHDPQGEKKKESQENTLLVLEKESWYLVDLRFHVFHKKVKNKPLYTFLKGDEDLV